MYYLLLSKLSETPAVNAGRLKKFKKKEGKNPFHHTFWVKKLTFQLSIHFAYLQELTVVIELGVFTRDDGAFSFCSLCSFPSGSVCTVWYDCHSSLMIHRYFSHRHHFVLLQNLSKGKRWTT